MCGKHPTSNVLAFLIYEYVSATDKHYAANIANNATKPTHQL